MGLAHYRVPVHRHGGHQDHRGGHAAQALDHHLARQLMSQSSAELPEAAVRRFRSGAFSSGLTVPDFAACLQLGLEPVGPVQGFCVMQWGWYGLNYPYRRGISPYGGGQGGYMESWQCPHGFVSNEHRSWGQNYEQSWIEDAWGQGFGTAYSRML